MKKQILIIADVDTPAIHLLNNADWTIYESKTPDSENEIFTMVRKVKGQLKEADKAK